MYILWKNISTHGPGSEYQNGHEDTLQILKRKKKRTQMLIYRRMDKQWYIYTVECNTAMKKGYISTTSIKTWQAIAGFEDGKGPWAKEYRQPLEAGKGKTVDSPTPEAPERNVALLTSGL